MSESPALNAEQTRPALTIPPGAPAVLLVVLTIAAYIPALTAGYIWDDDSYLTTNRNITSPRGVLQSWTRPTGPGANPQYYPMVFTSFWLEFRVWGPNAFGYHLDNILIHAANAVLIWMILRRLGVPGAWLGAALFALHPVNVESVAWITERKNVLSTFFYLLALLTYLRFSRLDSPDLAGPIAPRRWGWYLAAILFFALALFSKTVTCSLPAAILLLLWWKRGRIRMADMLPLVPMFVLGLGMAMVTSWVEQHHVRAKDLLLNLTPPHRILLAGRAVWFYLSKLIWPAPLTFFYPKWLLDPRSIAQYAYPASLLALLVVLWIQRRRIGRGPLVAVLMYVGTLVPALGFVDVYPMRYSWVADHFQYLACIAPLAAIAALLRNQIHRESFAIVGAVVLAVLGLLTYRQTQIYHDPMTLWRDTLNKNEAAWMAHTNLGFLLAQSGRPEARAEARQHLERAITLNPDHTQAYNNLAYLALTAGDPEKAIEYCERAIRVPNAELLDIFNNYGMALYTLRRDDEAVPYFEKSLKIRGDHIPARINLSRALLRLGRFDDAKKNLEIVFRMAPNQSEPRIILAEALIKRSRVDEALAQFQAAAECNPRDPVPRYKLAAALSAAGRMPDAIAEGRRLVSLVPGSADSHNLLGSLLLESGRSDEAVRELTDAVRIAPEMVEARFNFANALLRSGRPEAAAAEYREVLRRTPGDAEAERQLAEANRQAAATSPASPSK